MKNIIDYYYGIEVKKISYYDNKYYVDTENSSYIFESIGDNIEIIPTIIKQLEKYNYFLKIIKNVNSNYVTIINNKKYILFKKPNYENYKINIYDIKTNYYLNDYIDKNLKIKKMIELWENKIDTFEKIIFSKKEKYKNVISIFNYYVGMSENAVLYLKKIISEYKFNDIKLVASHKRINVNTKLYDYYNPVNIIVDYIGRDISEYIKSEIVEDSFEINTLSEYIIKNNISLCDINILFARLIFPTAFFDYIENNFNFDVKLLKNSIDFYEKALYDISELLYNKYGIKKIDWIYKNKNKH